MIRHDNGRCTHGLHVSEHRGRNVKGKLQAGCCRFDHEARLGDHPITKSVHAHPSSAADDHTRFKAGSGYIRHDTNPSFHLNKQQPRYRKSRAYWRSFVLLCLFFRALQAVVKSLNERHHRPVSRINNGPLWDVATTLISSAIIASPFSDRLPEVSTSGYRPALQSAIQNGAPVSLLCRYAI